MLPFSLSFFLATEKKEPYSTKPMSRKEPSRLTSNQYSLYSSSGNKVNANKTFIKPSMRIITSVISEICSVILSKKEPTIKPTPKFLIVSAKNLLLMKPIIGR